MKLKDLWNKIFHKEEKKERIIVVKVVPPPRVGKPRINRTDINVYLFIVTWKQSHDGNSPSIRDIRDSGLLKSTSSIDYVLGKLEACGYIKRIPMTARSIELIRENILEDNDGSTS